MDSTTAVVIAIFGFTGQIAAVVIAAILASRSARKAEHVADAIHRTTVSTHELVNNDRTITLELLADMALELSRDHPKNEALKERAQAAQKAARQAREAQDKGIGVER